MLREIGPGIAVADIPLKLMGINFGARMTVMARATGDLLLHSPVALSPELKAAVDRMGRVAHVVIPSTHHHLFAKSWIAAYPGVSVHTVAELVAKRPEFSAANLLSIGTPSPWGQEIDAVVVRGSKVYAEAVLFHRPSGTLVATDLVFNIQRCDRWVDRVAFQLYGAYGVFGPTRLERMLLRDRSHARAAIERMAQWPIKRVVMAHGDVRDPSTPAEWRAVFAWL